MQEFLVKHNIKEKVLAVAVSGGADSLALVLMAKEQLAVYGYKIISLTVNHGLRQSAADEAEYVSEIMQQYNIEHHTLLWTGEKPQTGVEEVARKARYFLLKQWCDEHNVSVLLVAHHLYDQAETFLMRLQRGSGLQGLCAIREVSDYDGLKILRPLLKTAPEVLKEYLRARNIKWVEDESNQDIKYLRNKIRKFLPVLDANTGISPKRLSEAVFNLQSADDYIEGKVNELFGTAINQYGNDVFCFAYKEYLRWHPEIKFRVISRLCKRQYIPRADSVMATIRDLNKLPFNGLTLGGRELFIAYGKIWVVPEMSAKHKSSKREWEDFEAKNPQYKNIKLPHKARLVLLATKEG